MLKRNHFSFSQGVIHLLESRSLAPDVVKSYRAQNAQKWNYANKAFMDLAGYVQVKYSQRSERRAANLMREKQAKRAIEMYHAYGGLNATGSANQLNYGTPRNHHGRVLSGSGTMGSSGSGLGVVGPAGASFVSAGSPN